jgi:small multidrug resistance pump/quaternary ammonium compound-resistance protein SugE
MALAQLVVASIAYAVGGLFMKLSEGLSRPWPTIAFSVLFLGGAMLQALGMRGSDLGVSFVFVLGVEAIGATALSTLYLHESLSLSRIAAVLLVVAGVAWLRRT